jgi:hypothetical protein
VAFDWSGLNCGGAPAPRRFSSDGQESPHPASATADGQFLLMRGGARMPQPAGVQQAVLCLTSYFGVVPLLPLT